MKIEFGYKTGIIALSEGKIVGDLIYQPYKELPRIRELKNLRIHQDIRDRGFASLMMRQAERENYEDFDIIIGDVRSTEKEVIHLLRKMGYNPLFNAYLHDSHKEDILFIKPCNI